MMDVGIYRNHVFGSNECGRVFGVLINTIKGIQVVKIQMFLR